MGNLERSEVTGKAGLQKYLSPLAVWGLSFGCAVGWGAFVMPGTTFLPAAGPLGTALGMLLGALVMWVIGVNYHYLMNRYPDAGGTMTYTIRSFGYDHGFLSAWFLILVYVAIIWANATALPLIGRNLFGGLFQFGFHYTVLGYDVYMGEALLSLAAIVLGGLIFICGKRLAVGLQIVFALVLFAGIVICAVAVFSGEGVSGASLSPGFAPDGAFKPSQIFTIIALSPWAFAGFESVSNSTAGFNFPVKKTIKIFTASLVTGAVSYILLTLMAASVHPEGYDSWTAHIKDLGGLSGLAGLPTFYAVNTVMGKAGVVILGVAALTAILTGLIGNYIAGSRLLYSMSEEDILPPWFGKLNADASPQNAILFLMGISLVIPFLGRTAIGWIIDVNTVGATIAYGYTSGDALYHAKQEGNEKVKLTGIIGLAMSVFFFFYFMAMSAGAMSTESYLILATWSILGFIYFRHVFKKDQERRFGKSTVVWIGLLFLIFFTSLMWVKQATDEITETVVDNISSYYETRNSETNPETVAQTEAYLQQQMLLADRVLTRNSIIQMILIMASLAIMFSIYTTISQREKQSEVEKVAAQESNRAKTVFLSNMSHDIRTPMNAIIGYINLAEREDMTLPQIREYLTKIKGSSQHLLALINDVLEMSRIESGKMELEPIAVDLRKAIGEVKDLFATQMSEKNIDFTVDTSHIKNSHVYCDKNRLNRVLLNLVSNAYKFTPEEGSVSVRVWEIDNEEKGVGKYELRVRDSGIGMSEEFAAKVFEAFERERTSTVSGIQGTGLGMSITKSIVDLMGGDISVQTAKDQGTEFTIRIAFKLQERPGEEEEAKEKQDSEPIELGVDFSRMRLLLVEDMPINREIANMQLTSVGFTIEFAENGQEAVNKVSASEPGYYDGVLMDIQMPVMNGYEAASAIRALPDPELSNLPIIAMTANAFSEDVKRAMDAGMDAHVAKPINLNILQNVLKEFLGKKRK
ncbi:MAG: amino acid permease [Lachnospiraceae bacterium]|nr:amino acid permease [Lachnospiraceae bacterium]